MEHTATVLSFPLAGKRSRRTAPARSVDGPKYFNETQIKLLRKTAKQDHDLALAKGLVTGTRNWMVIDLLTSTGLRVSEVSSLKIKDIHVGYGQSEIFVRDGKGHVSGTVVIPDALKAHLKSFLRWKTTHSERTGPEDPLFIGQRGAWTAQAIQQIVKGYLKRLNLYEPGKSVHALRHSYAVQLYSKERDLRCVQKQLRHVSIQSTTIYADLSKDQIAQQVDDLWG